MDFNALYTATTDRQDITVSGEQYSLKAWQGGNIRRVYVTRNGKNIGYFDADGDHVYEGRNFSPTTVQAWAIAAANAVLGIKPEIKAEEAKPAAPRLSFSNMSATSQPVAEEIPAPAVEAPAAATEEATPARHGVNAPLYGYKAFRLAQRRYRQLEVEAQNATLIAFEWSHRDPEIDAMHDKARLEIDAEMAALKPLIDAAQARIDAKIDAMEGGYERYFALWKKWRSL